MFPGAQTLLKDKVLNAVEAKVDGKVPTDSGYPISG